MAENKATAKKAMNGEPFIVQHINIRTINRTNQDIQKWRNAIKAAESVTNPQRGLLYDLYFDLLLDAHLLNVTSTRRRKITNSKLVFINAGEEVEEMEEVIESPVFYNLLTDLIDTRFWGFTLCEFYMKEGKLDYYLCPRKHVKPEKHIITSDPNDTTGIDYNFPPLDKYILRAGSEDDLGLYMSVAQYVLYKRGNFGDWAQFTELFGMPFRWGKYDGYDENTRLKLNEALSSMGSAAYAVLPENASVEVVQNNNNGNGDVYQKLKDACDEQISLAILGQTMTSKDGSSLSQAEVHATVAEQIFADDRKFICNILNNDFKKIMEAFGLPTDGHFAFIDDSRLNLKDRIYIDTQIADRVFIPDEYWFETYGIKKPDNYDELKAADDQRKAEEQAKAEEALKQQQQQQQEPNKLNTQENKHVPMRAVYNPDPVAIFNIPFIAASKNTMPRKHWQKMQAEARRLAELIYNDMLPDDYYVSEEMVRLVAEHLRKAIQAGFSTSFQTGSQLSDLLGQLENNIYKFSAAKNYNQLRDMNAMLLNSDGTRKTLNEFNQAVDAMNIEYNRNWQATEYNTVQASSQMASKWEQYQREAEDVPMLKWVTVGDERVRESHRRLEGLTLPANDPFWIKMWPPIDWGDRCDVIQAPSGKASKVNYEELPKPAKGFEGNPGATGEVFSGNHPYFKGVPADVASKIF